MVELHEAQIGVATMKWLAVNWKFGLAVYSVVAFAAAVFWVVALYGRDEN